MIKSNPLGYSVLSQSVKISRVDFEQCTFAVSTEIALIALRSDVTSFALSLGKGSQLSCVDRTNLNLQIVFCQMSQTLGRTKAAESLSTMWTQTTTGTA
jgi:hypothetical protein